MAGDDEVVSHIRVTATDETAGIMRGVQQSLTDVGNAFGRFMSAGAIAEFGRRSFLGFAQVQRGAEQLKFTLNLTTEQSKTLGNALEELAKKTGTSVEQLQKQYADFAAKSGHVHGQRGAILA
jgi:hypothetical protein